MNRESINRVIGGIDDELIEQAAGWQKKRSRIRAAAAAVLAAVLAILLLAPGIFRTVSPDETGETKPVTETVTNPETTRSEIVFTEKYVYGIDEGAFSAYVPGKVIDPVRIGEKICDASATGGWMNSEGEMLTEEHVKAEVYEIPGVPAETAVALRFMDKPEAMTTDHYYVLLNPQADLESVREYIIEERDNKNGEE